MKILQRCKGIQKSAKEQVQLNYTTQKYCDKKEYNKQKLQQWTI